MSASSHGGWGRQTIDGLFINVYQISCNKGKQGEGVEGVGDMGWWGHVSLIRLFGQSFEVSENRKGVPGRDQWGQRSAGRCFLGVQRRTRRIVAQRQSQKGECGGEAIGKGVAAGLWLHEKWEDLERRWKGEWCDLNYIFQVFFWFLWGKDGNKEGRCEATVVKR